MTYRLWTNKEVKFLTEVAEKMPIGEIAEKLDRQRDGIYKMAKRLGLKTTSHRKPLRWTPEQTELFDHLTNPQIVQLTGRTYDSVYCKRAQLRAKAAV
ncbi:hypothetical protein [Ewingella americana]